MVMAVLESPLSLASASATTSTLLANLSVSPTWSTDAYNMSGEYDSNTTLPIDMRFNEGHIVSITTYSVLMVISAVGNITVLVILLKGRKRSRSRFNTMLMHLSIADLLVTFLMMPLEIAWNATVAWLAGDAMCRIMAFFRAFGLYLSSFVLVCISVNRYFAVLRPMQISDRRGKIMLSGAWIAATVCSIPQSFVFHVERHPTFVWYEQCITFNSFTSDKHELVYSLIGMVATYCLPLAVIIFTYASILLEIFRRSRNPTDDRLRRSSLGFLGRAKIRTVKMTIVIVLVFFVCWTPYYVMCVWYWVDKQSAEKVDQRVQKGLFLFASTNSCMNPIVYGAFNMRGRRSNSQRQRQTDTRLGAMGVLRLVSWKKEADADADGGQLPSAGSSSDQEHGSHGQSQGSIPLSALAATARKQWTRDTLCSSCGESLAQGSILPASTSASRAKQTRTRITAPVPDVTAVAVARERGQRASLSTR